MLNNTNIVMLIVVLAVSLSWYVMKPTIDDAKIVSNEVPPIFAETLSKNVKIAIIGSGIGGSSAAYFLRKHLGSKAEIHVYEKANKVGGRLSVAEYGGHVFEAGGSIIHSSNKYMVRFINELGLERNTMSDSGKFGIYNGEKFVFIESAYSLITMLKMLWRYGFFSLWYLNRSLANIMEQFMDIYKIQDEGKAFSSVPEMLKAIGGDAYFDYTQKTAEEVMHKNGVGHLLIQELVTAVLRSNYGQDINVNALTGYVSMAGAQGGSLFSVKGGNYQVPQKLLEASNVTVFLKHHISSIRKEMHDGNVVYFLDEKDDNIRKEIHNGKVVFLLDDEENQAYDVVIVAAPLEVPKSYMKCSKCSGWPNKSILGSYQETIVTFIRSNINSKYFGFHNKKDILSAIFTTESPNTPFSSIGRQVDVSGGEVKPRIYKVFSRSKLKEHTVKELFQVNSSTEGRTKTITWLAYPHYTPPERFSPFVLDDGVFYVNTIERAASAMEFSTVGGRNVALLAKDFLVDTNRVISKTES